jgi:hypothetical protein
MTLTIARQMFAAEVLKLRRNRALMGFALLLSVGVVVIYFGYSAAQHASNPAQNGPAGGLLGFSRTVRATGLFFGSLVAALIGTEAGTADIAGGVYRDLVAIGRSRMSLFLVRMPAALTVTLMFTGTAFAISTVLSFVFAGGQPTPDASLILEAAGWVVLCGTVVVALAVGVGTVTGSRAVALTAVIGWQTVATQLLMQATSLGSARDALLTPALGQLMPVEGAVAGIAMATGLAVAVMAAWFTIPLIVGACRAMTQDA